MVLFAGAAARVAGGDVVGGFALVDVEAAVVEPAEAAVVEPAEGAVVEPVEAAIVELVDAVVVGVVAAFESEPQPPRAAKMETHTKPAHALSAPILKTIVTCPICVMYAESRRLQPRSRVTQTAFATFGNPAICRQQTGSFAPPPCDGFALERRAVNHEMKCRALCRCPETINRLICFVNWYTFAGTKRVK